MDYLREFVDKGGGCELIDKFDCFEQSDITINYYADGSLMIEAGLMVPDEVLDQLMEFLKEAHLKLNPKRTRKKVVYKKIVRCKRGTYDEFGT
jgi:hypothetical protein